jgi:hypothetical protein
MIIYQEGFLDLQGIPSESKEGERIIKNTLTYSDMWLYRRVSGGGLDSLAHVSIRQQWLVL